MCFVEVLWNNCIMRFVEVLWNNWIMCFVEVTGNNLIMFSFLGYNEQLNNVFC